MNNFRCLQGYSTLETEMVKYPMVNNEQFLQATLSSLSKNFRTLRIVSD